MLCLVSCSWIFLCYCPLYLLLFLFLFNDTATTELYTLSLHDALPISRAGVKPRPLKPVETGCDPERPADALALREAAGSEDRKSTRLNSSHANISYAVFCLKKKKKKKMKHNTNKIYRLQLPSHSITRR